MAEELNEKWLQRKNRAESILKSEKERYETRTGTRIQHIFAEPDQAIKDARHYKERETIAAILNAKMQVQPAAEEAIAHVIAHQHPIRESLWLDAIGEHRNDELIFVCGDIHLYTFRRLLEKQKIDSRIVAQGIGVDCACLADYRGLNFALAHQMFDETDCFCREN